MGRHWTGIGVPAQVLPTGPTPGYGGCEMDVALVLLTVVFFAVAAAYVRGCDRL
ncbi:MAG: hypothetical protein HY320_09910 [Armatimonadetes bacterium]|nr:hypothetical protein [Armatimonadota bacterium]